jgi:hypothetical protein
MKSFALAALLLLIPAADALAGCGGIGHRAAAAFTGRARVFQRLRVRAPVVNARVSSPPVLVVPATFPRPMPAAVPPVIVKPSPPALSVAPAVGSSTTVTRTVTKSVTPVVGSGGLPDPVTVTLTWIDAKSGCKFQQLSDGTVRKVGCPARR